MSKVGLFRYFEMDLQNRSFNSILYFPFSSVAMHV